MVAATVHQAAELLRLIRHHESRGDYTAVWGKISSHHRPKKPLTSMTIKEVLDWQDSIDHLYMSEAAGAYQFLEDTLRKIYAPAGFLPTDVMHEGTQDKLAVHLLKGRGFTRFLRGEISAEQFANNLAMEWASFPVVTPVTRTTRDRTWVVQPGSSYYSGDGLNKALVKPEEVLSVLRALQVGTSAGGDTPRPAPAPVARPDSTVVSGPRNPLHPRPGLLTGLLAALERLFGRRK